MTHEELVAELTAALREAGYEEDVEHDAEHGVLRLPGKADLGVAQLYSDLRGVPQRRRREALAKVARTLLDPVALPGTWDEARERILPVVTKRVAQTVEDLRRHAAGRPEPAPMAPITEHLVFRLGVPTAVATATVVQASLDRWGVGAEVAFEQAARNLQARSAGAWRAAKDMERVFVSPWHDGHDASRLFFPGAFASLPLRGRPVVIIPTPSLLLVAGDEDDEALFDLGRLGRRIMDAERMVHIVRPLRLGGDGVSWEDWLPPAGHPAHDVLRLLRVLEERADYDVQASALREVAPPGERLLALPGLEVQQSSLDASVRTATRWRADEPTALPRADVVVLVRAREPIGAVPWAELERVLGDALVAAPGYPERHLVDDFPADWQIAEMDLLPWTESRET